MTDAELIEAVAVEVMGWHLEDTDTDFPFWSHPEYGARHYKKDWNPLTDANHWMMVVETMWQKLGWKFILELHNINESKVVYWAIFWKKTLPLNVTRDSTQVFEQPGHAVCLAALEAMRNV